MEAGQRLSPGKPGAAALAGQPPDMFVGVSGPGGHLLHHARLVADDKGPHGKFRGGEYGVALQRRHGQIPMALVLPVDFHKIREAHERKVVKPLRVSRGHLIQHAQGLSVIGGQIVPKIHGDLPHTGLQFQRFPGPVHHAAHKIIRLKGMIDGLNPRGQLTDGFFIIFVFQQFRHIVPLLKCIWPGVPAWNNAAEAPAMVVRFPSSENGRLILIIP